jgi:glucosyl-dolichyl phosphate glucuronosyltransferase
MKISVVIPTHNRADQLQTAIDSIIPLRDEAALEIVVVDNNSTDATREVAQSYAGVVRYVFEGRTSFSRARNTGGEFASGDVLLYLDDDVIVHPGSLKNLAEVFTRRPDCGVVAGKILPRFTAEPPPWTLACQQSFNGWSLFSGVDTPGRSEAFQEVASACGPMLAVRKSVFQLVGGFPPDTLGVETNRGGKLFNKLYVGPGDYGLCHLARQQGYKIYYHPAIAVFHVIPPIRFTVSFWRSRMIGEGYHEAITQRAFYRLSAPAAFKKRLEFVLKYYQWQERLRTSMAALSPAALQAFAGVFPAELWVRYFKAYLEMDAVLQKYPALPQYLWDIGSQGVNDDNFDRVMEDLPQEYKELVSDATVYESAPLDSLAALARLADGPSYGRSKLRPVLGNRFVQKVLSRAGRLLRDCQRCCRPQASGGA